MNQKVIRSIVVIIVIVVLALVALAVIYASSIMETILRSHKIPQH